MQEAEFCANEIEKVDFTRCPFEKTHPIHKETQFLPHITKCKERARVAHILSCCRYSPAHFFIDSKALNYHEPRCEFHPRRKQINSGFGLGMATVTLKCRFNSLHLILNTGDLADHEAYCPNRNAPVEDPALRLKRIREQATDNTPTGILNRNHGFAPADKNVYSMPTKVLKLREETYGASPYVQDQKLMIHLSSFTFSVVKNEVKQVPEMHIYIDNFTHADKEHYPGLRELEESRTHHTFLVAYLYEDTSDPTSQNMFKRLCTTLTMQQAGHPVASIGMCNSCAGSENAVYLIVHRSETSGFGGRIEKSEIGLFCIPSTFLYGRVDSRQQLKDQLLNVEMDLASLQKLHTELLQRSVEYQAEANRLNHLATSQEKQYWAALIQKEEEFNSKIERYKSDTSQMLLAYKDTARQTVENCEAKLKSALVELDRVRQEKLTIQHNAQSEMNDKQRLTERVADLEKIAKAKDKQLTKANLTIKQKTEDYSTSLRRLTERNQKYSTEIESIRRLAETSSTPSACHQEEQVLCNFCMEKNKNTVFVPCGHLIYCSVCIEQHFRFRINAKLPENDPNRTCPMCKDEIQRINLCYAY